MRVSEIIRRGTLAARPAATAVAAGTLYYDTTNSILYRSTGSAWESVEGAGGSLTVEEADGTPSVAASTLVFPNGTLTDNGSGEVEYTPAGGGGTITGFAPYAGMPGFDYREVNGTYSAASEARMQHILVPAPMYVRALRIASTSIGSGTHQWGLFDASANAAAATKVAGGSGTLANSSDDSIVAASAPVLIDAGAYILIWHWPAANMGNVQYRTMHNTSLVRQYVAYTWDDTPDLTAAGWIDSTTTFLFLLVGDMDASGNQW